LNVFIAFWLGGGVMCKLVFHSHKRVNNRLLVFIILFLPCSLGFAAPGGDSSKRNEENIKALKTKVLIKSQEAKTSKQREIQAKKALEELEQEKEGESAEKIKSQNDFNSNLQSVGNGGLPSQKSEVTEQYQLTSKASQYALYNNSTMGVFSDPVISSEQGLLTEEIAKMPIKPTVITANPMPNDQAVLSSSADYVHHLNPNKPSLPEIETISDSEDV